MSLQRCRMGCLAAAWGGPERSAWDSVRLLDETWDPAIKLFLIILNVEVKTNFEKRASPRKTGP